LPERQEDVDVAPAVGVAAHPAGFDIGRPFGGVLCVGVTHRRRERYCRNPDQQPRTQLAFTTDGPTHASPPACYPHLSGRTAASAYGHTGKFPGRPKLAAYLQTPTLTFGSVGTLNPFVDLHGSSPLTVLGKQPGFGRLAAEGLNPFGPAAGSFTPKPR